MDIELRTALLSYSDDGEELTAILRKPAQCEHPPRTGDRVVAHEAWEPATVTAVTWDGDLTRVAVELDVLDADVIGPAETALELLTAAGWQPIPDHDELPLLLAGCGSRPAALSKPLIES